MSFALTLRLIYLLLVQVSPYLEFGNALEYLKCHPEADRVFILREIASGASLPFTCIATH
jgi:hypothetical protein